MFEHIESKRSRLLAVRADDLNHIATLKTLHNGLAVSLETDVPPAREQLDKICQYLKMLGHILEQEIGDIDYMLSRLADINSP